MAPQAVAAIIGAEAGVRRGVWDPNSRNNDHLGLAQFSTDTWIDETQRPGTYLNNLARNAGYLDQRGRVRPDRRVQMLELRTDPTHAINATTEYAAHNLNRLRRRGLITDESPEALARYAYIAHHDGPAGAVQRLRGTRQASQSMFEDNVPRAERERYLRENGNDRNRAYQAFMRDYTDRQIDFRRYTSDQTAGPRRQAPQPPGSR